MIGADVSMHQPGISWTALAAAGIRYAWIKTTEGGRPHPTRPGYLDPAWDRHRTNATAAGIPWGGYHFARVNAPGTIDALDEAEWFVQAGGMTGPLPGVLDLESTSLNRGETIEWAVTWCQRVEALTGRTPVVYWGAFFATAGRDACPNDPALARYPWWMPAYDHAHPHPGWIPRTNGPRIPDVWQFTDRGRIPGYDGPLDLNVCDEPTLTRLLGSPAPDPLEALVSRAVHCPDHTGGTVWQIIDGLQRVGYSDPADLAAAVAYGAVDHRPGSGWPADADVTQLRGEAADRFLARYFAQDLATVHWSGVLLMRKTVEQITAALPDSINPDVVKTAVTEALAGTGLPVTLTPGDLDALVRSVVGKLAQATQAAADDLAG